MRKCLIGLFTFILTLVSLNTHALDEKREESKTEQATLDKQSVLSEVEEFFGKGAEQLSEVIEKMFAEQGSSNGFVKGEEIGGAFVVGLRYGYGVLNLNGQGTKEIYWQSPSIGFDVGGNAAKVFMLVYNLPSIESIFQRYPGVDGSLYVVGGVGFNYVQSGKIILAPIRLGVGWRAGASVGYMVVTRDKSINPF